jgi:hypothetical protein
MYNIFNNLKNVFHLNTEYLSSPISFKLISKIRKVFQTSKFFVFFLQNLLFCNFFTKCFSSIRLCSLRGHTFGFIRCWLQPLSHFVVTNIRKFFQTSKYFFVNLIQVLLRIPSEYYFHKILVV